MACKMWMQGAKSYLKLSKQARYLQHNQSVRLGNLQNADAELAYIRMNLHDEPIWMLLD